MQISISGKNIDLTEAIKSYIQQKMDKLDRYLEGTDIISCSVLLDVKGGEGSKGAPRSRVEVMLVIPGAKIRCEELHEDLYAAVDMVQEKIERKIRDFKEKALDKRRDIPSGGKSEPTDMRELEKIVRRKRVNLDMPITEDEAISNMELLGHDFYLYTDAITNRNAIVYRRKDGGYGLIQT